MKYAQIIFLQGDEGRRIVDQIANVEGVVAHGATQESIADAVSELAQWDYGDEMHVEPCTSRGSLDSVESVEHDGSTYVLSWNLGLGCVGLERVIFEDLQA